MPGLGVGGELLPAVGLVEEFDDGGLDLFRGVELEAGIVGHEAVYDTAKVTHAWSGDDGSAEGGGFNGSLSLRVRG